MKAYYNEIDPYAAQWLRNLIGAGHIAPGDVDERDIRDVTPEELSRYTQCHFFAGIGIWSHALRRAGWEDDRPIWTGSCPCQPFSAAGKGAGFDDERHLWPVWYQLIAQCRPPIILGEQVASKDGLQWLDLVSSDMEGAAYAVGASDLCAAGFQESHIRQRLYFVGVADPHGGERKRVTNGEGRERDGQTTGRDEGNGSAQSGSAVSRVADADLPGQYERPSGGQQSLCNERDRRDENPTICNTGPIAERWLNVDWLLCRNPTGEPSWRPVEPGTFPLAHGVAARMGKLRAYGNGLDLETATGFIEAVMEAMS